MPSILPDFEYDIFVSYRQKDNKFDGWVSRFIADLQNELDATFKEDINIYFDENPHNGLLDIHDVDKSLKTKLKSAIFIPIQAPGTVRAKAKRVSLFTSEFVRDRVGFLMNPFYHS